MLPRISNHLVQQVFLSCRTKKLLAQVIVCIFFTSSSLILQYLRIWLVNIPETFKQVHEFAGFLLNMYPFTIFTSLDTSWLLKSTCLSLTQPRIQIPTIRKQHLHQSMMAHYIKVSSVVPVTTSMLTSPYPDIAPKRGSTQSMQPSPTTSCPVPPSPISPFYLLSAPRPRQYYIWPDPLELCSCPPLLPCPGPSENPPCDASTSLST